jgi:hypothetical protein
MKNFIKLGLIFILFQTATSFTNNYQNKLKTGFYCLADSEEQATMIKDVDSDMIFGVDRNEFLTVDDFSAVNYKTINTEPIPLKVIELKFTKEGRKKWANSVKKISASGESIVFVCNDKVYLEKRIYDFSNKEHSNIYLAIDKQHQEFIFNTIKSEIKEKR